MIRQVSAFLKAWNWSLRPTRLTLVFDVSIATSTSLKYACYSTTSSEIYPGRLQQPGTTPTPLNWTSSATSPWRPEASISDVNSAAFIILLTTPRDTRPGPRQNFSSPPESPMDGLFMFRLSYVPAYLRSGLPTYNSFDLSGLPPLFVIVIVIVHHQFKRNIYLSLLCDWNFLCLKIIFLFFSSKYAVEACDIY